jgi:purine-binding chemotaxis protein CheW
METYEENIYIDDLDLDEDTQKDKYLIFIINEEFYAIDIKYVTEIIGIQKITEVPNIKKFIKGIINLRGNITPVINIRSRFNIPEIEFTERTCIIVVSFLNFMVGLIVDEVSEVLNISQDKISPAPHTNKGSKSRFIDCIGKIENKITIILDLNNLLYDQPIELAEETEVE